MIYISIISIIILLDLSIKKGIEMLPKERLPYTKDGSFITICRLHNKGLIYGRLEKYPQLVTIIPISVTSSMMGIFSYIIKKKGHILEKCGYAFALGGAIGNLIDRLSHGYVVDYIKIDKKPLKNTIFNLADICIVIGTILLSISSIVKMIKDIKRKER